MKENIQGQWKKNHPSCCSGRRENWWGMCHLVCAIIAAWRVPVLAISHSMPAAGSCPAWWGMQPWGWQDLLLPSQGLGSRCLHWSEPGFHFGERKSSDRWSTQGSCSPCPQGKVASRRGAELQARVMLAPLPPVCQGWMPRAAGRQEGWCWQARGTVPADGTPDYPELAHPRPAVVQHICWMTWVGPQSGPSQKERRWSRGPIYPGENCAGPSPSETHLIAGQSQRERARLWCCGNLSTSFQFRNDGFQQAKARSSIG